MPYLIRIPITVLTKKSSSRKYRKNKWYTGYAELNMRSNGAIEFNIRFGNGARDYKIPIGKWPLFQMFLFHLSIRPIWQTKAEFYPDKSIKEVIYEDIDRIPIRELIERYDDAVENLRMIIPTMTGGHKKHAERQMEQLLGRQWKIDLLRQIELSGGLKSNALPEKLVK